MTKTRNDELFEQGVKAGKEGYGTPPIVDGIEESMVGILFGRNASEQVRKDNDIIRKGVEEGARQREDSKGSSDSSSDSSDSGGSSSGGGCYLTTACVNARGLPDNCLELNVLRNFRDRILLQNPTGRGAVKEYYKIAPEIVQSINGKDNSSEIWNSVYQDIRKAVQFVLLGDFNSAFEHYRKMTLGLKN